MLGLALLAACMPAQEDWLNEWSSTPPVSRTMHAVNFLPVPPLRRVLVFVRVRGRLRPQPTASRASAPTTATILVA